MSRRGSPPATVVRPVGPHQYEEAGAVVVDAYRAVLGTKLSIAYAAELADVAARVSGATVLVAVDGEGSVVGCVTYVPDPTSPWAEDLRAGEAAIRMLAVAPTAQGQGLGRRLTEACIIRARQAGASALALHSTEEMGVAHALYRSLGFERAPDRDWEPEPGIWLLAFLLSFRS